MTNRCLRSTIVRKNQALGSFAVSVGRLGDYTQMAKHIHQFQRKALGKAKDYIVYACVMPNCSTYHPEELILGKESRCNRCKENIIHIKRNSSGKIPHKPHCPECTSEPKNPNLRRKKVVRVPRQIAVDLTKLLLE